MTECCFPSNNYGSQRIWWPRWVGRRGLSEKVIRRRLNEFSQSFKNSFRMGEIVRNKLQQNSVKGIAMEGGPSLATNRLETKWLKGLIRVLMSWIYFKQIRLQTPAQLSIKTLSWNDCGTISATPALYAIFPNLTIIIDQVWREMGRSYTDKDEIRPRSWSPATGIYVMCCSTCFPFP